MTYRDYLLHEVRLVDESIGDGSVPNRFLNTERESIERANETVFRMGRAEAIRQRSERNAAFGMTL